MTHYVNVPLSETTYRRIKRLAVARQRDVAETIAEYLAETLTIRDEPTLSPNALADEITAFEAFKPELLQTYPGEFVAIYQQQIVGFDPDEMNLIRRVYEQYGPVPCYVEQIIPETPRKVKMISRWKQRQ